jgi:hypothetical protein
MIEREPGFSSIPTIASRQAASDGLPRSVGQTRDRLRDHGGQGHDVAEEPVLRAVEADDEARVDARLARDAAHRRALVAELGELTARRPRRSPLAWWSVPGRRPLRFEISLDMVALKSTVVDINMR